MTEAIQSVIQITYLTFNHLTTFYQSVFDKEAINLEDKIFKVVKIHKHVPNAKDPESGVQEFVFGVMTDLRALGGAQFMKQKSQAKFVITRLANSLKPKEFKELLFRDKTM